MDDRTTINDLKLEVQLFCEARDWDKFHNPKDLAIGVVTEASELLEIFRFKDDRESAEVFTMPEQRKRVADEMADTLYFIVRLAQKYDIDLASSFRQKMQENEEKYPVDLFQGSNKKYNE